jgi:hypothetical protein
MRNGFDESLRWGDRLKSVLQGEKIAWVFSLLSLGFGIVLLLDAYLTHNINMGLFFNSDELYLSALFREIYKGQFSFFNWHFSAATFIFPDWIMYGFVFSIFRNSYLSFPAFFVVQTLLAWGLSFGICHLLMRDKLNALLGSSFFLSLSLFFALKDIYPFTIVMYSVTHFGDFLSWLATTFLLLNALSQTFASRRFIEVSTFIGVGLLSFLATGSDRLFVPHWIAPAIVAMGILNFNRRIGRGKFLSHSGSIVLGAISGLGLYHLYPHVFNGVGIAIVPAKDNAPVLFRMGMDFFKAHGVISGIFLLAGFGWIALIHQMWFSIAREDRFDTPTLFLAIFFSVGLIVSLVTMVFSTYRIMDDLELRYLLPYLLGPILLLPILLQRVLNDIVERFFYIAAILILLVVELPTAPHLGHIVWADYYPQEVSCVDRALSREGTTRGIALYWDARRFAMMSKIHAFDIAQVNDDLSPYFWINSDRSYRGLFRFALVPESSEGAIFERNLVSRMGTPAVVKDCPGIKVDLWSKPFGVLIK